MVGTDPEVDLRLPAVAEIDVPYYPGLQIGVPSLPAAVQTLADGAFDAIHVCSPGPAGIAGALVARALGLPLIGSYHTELTAYADLRSGQQQRRRRDGDWPSAPSTTPATSSSPPAPPPIGRWPRSGCAAEQVAALGSWRGHLALRPVAARSPALLPRGEVNVLYSGRITREKGADLLADAFLRRARANPRLHLVLAGGGPEQERLAERLGEHATFLGWLAGEELARAYASADLFLFPSATDTFGQVILEAQASGLPVIAVAEGGPLSLIENRVTGLLCEAYAAALADALLELAGSPLLRERLSRGGARRRARAHLGAGAGAAGRGLPAALDRGCRELDARAA